MTELSTNVSRLDGSMPGYSMFKAECTCNADHHSQMITVEYDSDADWTDICIYYKAHTKELVSRSSFFKNLYYKSDSDVLSWFYEKGWQATELCLRVKYALKLLFTGYIQLEHYYTMRSPEHHQAYIAAIEEGLAEAHRNRAEVLVRKAKVNK